MDRLPRRGFVGTAGPPGQCWRVWSATRAEDDPKDHPEHNAQSLLIFCAFVVHGEYIFQRRIGLNIVAEQSIVQYYPLYRYPLFQKMGFGHHDCPVLESWWDNSFSFPWYCGMTDETIGYMVNSTKAAIDKLKNS
jgi:dTDP-4-amino-4,6-dideoxygalactose transaminase